MELHNYAPAASPARSSLISRRLHGPRRSGSGRKERRKTVIFADRCDVMEFSPDDEEEEEVFESAEDDVDEGGSDEDDSFFYGAQGHPFPASDVVDEGGSFDSIHVSGVEAHGSNSPPLRLDPDVSITGLVDEILSNAAADEASAPGYSTPPRSADTPLDLKTENGGPLGHSHHDYQNQRQSPLPVPLYFLLDESQIRGSPSIPNSPGGYPFNLSLSPRASPHGQPSAPQKLPAGNVTSTPPFGGSIHVEHVRGAREGGNAGEYSVVDDLERLSVSPPPVKKSLASSDSDTFAPLFDITIGRVLFRPFDIF